MFSKQKKKSKKCPNWSVLAFFTKIFLMIQILTLYFCTFQFSVSVILAKGFFARMKKKKQDNLLLNCANEKKTGKKFRRCHQICKMWVTYGKSSIYANWRKSVCNWWWRTFAAAVGLNATNCLLRRQCLKMTQMW